MAEVFGVGVEPQSKMGSACCEALSGIEVAKRFAASSARAGSRVAMQARVWMSAGAGRQAYAGMRRVVSLKLQTTPLGLKTWPMRAVRAVWEQVLWAAQVARAVRHGTSETRRSPRVAEEARATLLVAQEARGIEPNRTRQAPHGAS